MRIGFKLWIPLFLLILTISCERITNEGKGTAKKVEVKVKSAVEKQTKKVVDKIFPPFDHDKPDTKNNKNRFRDFIKVDITPDIKNIYCYGDAIGIDTDYMFSFHCNRATVAKILEKHHLTIDSIGHDNGFGLQHDFPWWDKSKIEKLQKFSWTDGKQYHKYFWYDSVEGKAYFFDFDM